MHFQSPESSGPAGAKLPPEISEQTTKSDLFSTNLAFGQPASLSSITGPSYVTPQTLVQQLAYSLSDRLWTFSPETFDLDILVKKWSDCNEHNAHGRRTEVQSMETRLGGLSVALGYVFSKDFDVTRRHIPQSIIASTSALPYLFSTLDELSLLYPLASPFVAHIAAINYAGASSQLVADYVSALSLADELGFGILSSSSVYESQHMSLLATLLAQILPMINIYDGVNTARETVRVIDVLDQAGLSKIYRAIQEELSRSQEKKTNIGNRVLHCLKAFNEELGTQYKPFEYHGHHEAETVLVVFGTVEAALAQQVCTPLAASGVRIGVINVRVCKPFLEDEFLTSLPKAVRTIGVLGQVHDHQAVADSTLRSNLYDSVVGAIAFSEFFNEAPSLVDLKYARDTVWTPASFTAAFQLLTNEPLARHALSAIDGSKSSIEYLDSSSIQQYTFWDFDGSEIQNAGTTCAQTLAKDSTTNVTTNTIFDNLLGGGIARTDIRISRATVEAAYTVKSADAAFVGDLNILKEIDVIRNVKAGGQLMIKGPGLKDDELDTKLPPSIRKALSTQKIQLHVLDPHLDESSTESSAQDTHLVQSAFLHLTSEATRQEKSGVSEGSASTLPQTQEILDRVLRKIEIPDSWADVEIDKSPGSLPSDLLPSSFVPFQKQEDEPPTFLKDWKTPALGLTFKEAYNTRTSLRPDVPQKTFTVHVKENRRLTPSTYERNIFHIEFDLGTSGLTYDIGEALGVHAENDPKSVDEFIKFYQLDPGEIVEVPSREDPAVLENRTIYQSLMQNVDIFGQPPKRFYEALAEFADDAKEAQELKTLGGPEGAKEFKRRAEVDTVTYADVLLDFPSAHPSFHDIVRIVNPMKRREYSIASCQKVTPNSVALMIVVVNWTDPKGRDRFGQATKFLWQLQPGAPVTVSVKPSVMKLPPNSTDPLIMAGLGTGLAPFRAFVQHRAWEKAQGKDIGEVLLYMGSRHQREEYCYGEEWEAYRDAGVITLLGRAFSRDQPQKIYIQDRMRESLDEIIGAYLKKTGAFYLCGPTWPVPDVTSVLQEAIAKDAQASSKKVQPRKEIDRLKEDLRYVLEVY